MELSVDISAHGDRTSHLLHIRLLRQNLFGLGKKWDIRVWGLEFKQEGGGSRGYKGEERELCYFMFEYFIYKMHAYF